MSKIIRLLMVLAAGLAIATVRAAPPRADDAVAAQVTKLASDDKAACAAAVEALVAIGRPAAPALVQALQDPREEVRAGAAAALRRILAADPAAAPNRHDRTHWERRLAELRVGMTVDQALAVLLPDATPEMRRAAVQAGAWSGQSGFSIVRLDDYWTANLPLTNARNETLAGIPTLARSVRNVWVAPPAGHSGPWTAWFVNGQKAHAIEYKDGVYHGTFTAFRDDGGKLYEQHYVKGVCEGADTGWYPGGAKMYEGTYRAGNQDGRWQHWYADGTPQCARDYAGGKPHGLWVEWAPNGQKRHEQHYLSGRQDGIDRSWDETGKLLWERTYRGGELVENR